MANRTDGFQGMVGLVLVLLGVSAVVPAIFIATESPQTNAFEQQENVRQTLTGEVSSQVTNLNNQDEINVTLLNRRDGSIDSTGILAVGETTNVTISGTSVEITNIDVIDGNSVLVRYTYPLYLGWPDKAEGILKSVTNILILGTVVLVLGITLTGYKVFVQ